MFQNIREELQLFKKSKKHILIFEFSYKLLAAAVIYPLIFFLVNTGMKFAGISYLTNEYIMRTVTSPYVIAAIIVIVLAVILYCIFEMSFMLASYEYNRRDADVTFYATALSAFHKMRECFHFKNTFMMLFYMITIAVVNVTILCNMIFTQTTRDLFKIGVLNGHWYVKAALAIALLIIFIVSFLGIYSFHIFFLEEKNFGKAYAKSSRMVLKHLGCSIWSIIRYNLLIIVTIAVVYGFISLVLVAGVKLLDMAYIGSAVYLSVLRNVRFAVKALLCCIAIPVSFLMLTRNYYKFTDDKEIEFPIIYLRERYTKLNKVIYFALAIFSTVSLIVNVVRTFNDNPFEKIAIFHETKITAHRGSSKEAPENTIAAFKKAMDELADYIELDVHMTSDGEIVVMHDDNVLRTTGVNGLISNMTLKEIKQLDAGSWFSPEYANERVPTLQEVLDLSQGKIKINIEIKAKTNGLEIAEKVADIISKNNAQNWCVVTSFDHAALERVKECDKDVKVGYILSVAYGSFYEMNDVDFFSVNASFLTKRTVDAIHNSGKEVYAWTVNNEDAIRNLTNKGVDNIITDNPILATETVYSRNTSETVLNMLKYVFNQ